LLVTLTQNFPNKPILKPTKSLRNIELDERKSMRLFFWCEEKFVPGYRCKNKKLYSLYIVEDDNDMEEKDK
jgi:hypothetical protein